MVNGHPGLQRVHFNRENKLVSYIRTQKIISTPVRTNERERVNPKYVSRKLFCQRPIILTNVFSRGAMSKMANIKLVSYGALRFEYSFQVPYDLC